MKRKRKKTRFKKRIVFLYLIPVYFLLTFLLYSYFKTGMFHPEKIDDMDLKKWTYGPNGIIQEAEEFSLQGSKTTCWLLIHGYASTPKDMNELAPRINDKFNEFVKVPRLKGHGEVPSKLLGLSIDDWYNQIEQEYLQLQKECDKINLAGFSMGGAIALKIAENHNINNLYLISPYLRLRYKFWNIFNKEMYINLLADLFIYKEKTNIAQVNSPEGMREHIAYISSPLQPVKRSFPTIDGIISNLEKIKNPTLIQHSKRDDTIDFKSSRIILKGISSENKKLIPYLRSNHVILRDYNKEEVINNIISFEEQTR